MQMWIYIVRRVLLIVPIVIGVMTITFLLLSSLPINEILSARFGDPPIRTPWLYDNPIQCKDLSPNGTGTCQNPYYWHYVDKLGLNQPAIVQWGTYVVNTFTLNWGTVSNGSYAGQSFAGGIAKGLPVTEVLGWLLPYTLELAAFALVIILAVAIPLGNLSAVYRNRPIDQGSRVISFSGYALPAFLLGPIILMGIVILLGSVGGWDPQTPWCPSGEPMFNELSGSWPQIGCFANHLYPAWLGGSEAAVISTPTGFPTVDAAIHGQWWLAIDTVIRMILPALVIAFGAVAVLLRYVRNSMLEVMSLDFVRTARAKGVPEQGVIRRHAGRNSLNVTVTVLGLTFAFFIGGFPVIEDVFKLNGVGLILADSVANGKIDVGLVFGSTLLFTFLVVAANIIVDVLYAYLDPRVRLG